jgi:hypothetical protein
MTSNAPDPPLTRRPAKEEPDRLLKTAIRLSSQLEKLELLKRASRAFTHPGTGRVLGTISYLLNGIDPVQSPYRTRQVAGSRNYEIYLSERYVPEAGWHSCQHVLALCETVIALCYHEENEDHSPIITEAVMIPPPDLEEEADVFTAACQAATPDAMDIESITPQDSILSADVPNGTSAGSVDPQQFIVELSGSRKLRDVAAVIHRCSRGYLTPYDRLVYLSVHRITPVIFGRGFVRDGLLHVGLLRLKLEAVLNDLRVAH